MFTKKYYPTLRTREAELLALEKLNENRKDLITPLLTFGKTRKNIFEAGDIFKAVESAFGERDYILDLTHDREHLAPELEYLKNPDGHYQAWRDLLNRYQVKIPCVIQSDLQRKRDFVRQALMLESQYGALAFRIRNLIEEPSLVINALNALDDVSNSIVFIDPNYISNNYDSYVATTLNAIRLLRASHPDVKICILPSTFPQSVTSYSQDAAENWGLIPLSEHEFHKDMGGTDIVIYGDHSSVHAAIYNERGGRWVPRIDYPRLEECYFERRRFDQGAAKPYTEAAKAIVRSCPELTQHNDIWGIQQIIEAAQGDLFARNASAWIAVRVNIYLSRQIDYWNQIDTDQPKNFSQEFLDELLDFL